MMTIDINNHHQLDHSCNQKAQNSSPACQPELALAFGIDSAALAPPLQHQLLVLAGKLGLVVGMSLADLAHFDTLGWVVGFDEDCTLQVEPCLIQVVVGMEQNGSPHLGSSLRVGQLVESDRFVVVVAAAVAVEIVVVGLGNRGHFVGLVGNSQSLSYLFLFKSLLGFRS